MGVNGLYMWDRSRPAFVYGQCVTGGGGKATTATKQVGCTLLDFLKVEVCPRTLKASVSCFS